MQSKQTKSRAILLSVLVVVMCLAVILGATFALFTSRREYQIGVNTGKIDVQGELTLTQAWSQGQSTNEREEATVIDNTATLPQGGTVAITDGSNITINNMSLGDGAAFELAVTNASAVDMKYSVTVLVSEGGSELRQALQFSVDGVNKSLEDDEVSLLDWQTVEAGQAIPEEDATLAFEISLPWSALEVFDPAEGEGVTEPQSVSMTVVLEALQANAYTGTISAGDTTYETLAEAMAQAANNETISLGRNVNTTWLTQEEAAQLGDKPLAVVGAGESLTTIEAADNGTLYIPANVTLKDVTVEGNVVATSNASIEDATINGSVTISDDQTAGISTMSLMAFSNAATEAEGGTAMFDGVTFKGSVTATNANVTIVNSMVENGAITLNGGTLTLSNSKAMNKNGSALTVGAEATATVTSSSLTAEGADTIVNNGTLTIGTGAVVDALTHAKTALFNNAGATFYLEGGTLTRSLAAGTYEPYGNGGNSYYALINRGTAYLNSGSVVMNDGYSSLIENGYFSTPAQKPEYMPTMIISGGTFSGGANVVKNDEYGVMTINGGTFTNASQAAVQNWNDLTINDGQFTNSAYAILSGGYGADSSALGLTKVNGGTFEGNIIGYVGTPGDYQYAEKVTYTITGGTFNNTVAEAYTLAQLNEFTKAGIEVLLMQPLTITSNLDLTLGNDITVNDTLRFQGPLMPKRTVNIDLNGYTMYFNQDGLIDIYNNVVFTIGNGSMIQSEDSELGYLFRLGSTQTAYPSPTLTITGGTYVCGLTAVQIGNKATANIQGGTFSAIGSYDNRTWILNKVDNSQSMFNVTGGAFVNYNPANSTTENPAESFLGEGYVAWEVDGTYYVGTPEEAAAAGVVVMMDSMAYSSLAYAVADVPTDNTQKTITFIAAEDTVYGSGVKVSAGQNIVIDFAGKTFVVVDPTVGSAGTETNLFQLLKGSTVVMMNGSVKSEATEGYILIQKYNDLTLQDMVLDASDDPNMQYVVSSNCGTTTIKGNTQIIASSTNPAGVAFDLWYGMSTTYEDGVSVVFASDFTGKVSGKIEYGAQNMWEGWQSKTVWKVEAGCTGTFDVTLRFTVAADAPAIEIAGGTFTSDFVKDYLAEGFELSEVEGGWQVVPASEEQA